MILFIVNIRCNWREGRVERDSNVCPDHRSHTSITFRGAAPFSLVTGETCRKNEGLVVTGQVSTKTFIFPAVSKHSKSSTSTACHLPKTARHYTPLGTQVPAAHACAIELSFGATTIFSRHSRHISSKTRRIGKPLRKRGHILHRVGMIF